MRSHPANTSRPFGRPASESFFARGLSRKRCAFRRPTNPARIPVSPKGCRYKPCLLPALALLGALAACAPIPPPMGYEAGPAFERRIIGAVNFDFNSYRIRPDSFALLDNTALALNDPQLYGLMFEINGHTDVSGRLGYNVGLSMLRASAVVDYLAARGVPRERMRSQGFGPLQPFDPYNLFSPANRRVEIVALR